MDFAVIYAELVKVVAVAAPHWYFFAYAFILAFLGEISKRYVFTERNIASMEKLGTKLWNVGGFSRISATIVLAFARMPFALHPVIVGTLAAFIPGLPFSPGIMVGVQAVIYMFMAAMLSLAIYDFLRGVWKLVWVYLFKSTDPVPEIHFPGEEDPNE